MKRWLPHPLVTLGLAFTWLMLNQSLSAAQFLAAAIIGVAGGRALAKLQPPPVKVRRLKAIALLFVRVSWDIFRSNLAVARIIMLPRTRHARSTFVYIPLRMKSPYGLALLGGIITAAPGTVWVDYDTETGILLTHVLDLIDEKDWMYTIQTRYQALLMEIFDE